MIVTHSKPVGVDVLDDPKNKGISLFHGGEKAKNDCWRVVEDVDPYKHDGNPRQTVGATIGRPL